MRIWPSAPVLIVLLGVPAAARTDRVEPERERLSDDVHRLASPEFAGRSGDGARAAGDFLIDRLEAMGLEPAFDGSFEQAFRAGEREGRNIGAILRGSDAERRDEWIIVSAHYDHLGVRGGRIYPGADDNATGVAMTLEVARCLAECPDRRGRSLMFVFFDLEEEGLLGSRHFVRQPPVPIARIGLFLTADMLGRSLAGVCGDALFAMGTEHAPGLRPWLAEAAEGLPLTLGVVGADVLMIDRSDYGPFRVRQVPFLFFSTGESPDYHTPKDVPETIEYEKLTAASRLIHRVVRRAAAADALPRWESEPEPWIGEARTIREIFSRILVHGEQVGLPGLQRRMMQSTIDRIDRWIADERLSPVQRSSMIRVAQFVLFTAL